MGRETKNLEFKERVSRTFLKTVSAYANYEGGIIRFGVRDDGTVAGLEQPSEDALKIEHLINDSIDPVPDYSLSIEDDSTITLNVEKGVFTPYLYQGSAYRRSDTSTIKVERLEYNRLVLKGQNLSFEEAVSDKQDLSFGTLENELVEHLGISGLTDDVLKTLELVNQYGEFNNAAALLADSNNFSGLDCARFGDNVNEIRKREQLFNVSVLEQLHRVIELFREHYVYELVQGSRRETVELIPQEAFREAIANALVHRRWDIPGAILVRMHPNRIEVSSPGSLPEGISVDEYLEGYLSLPRNPILANVFFRLGYIEKFGTGIARIKYAYRNSIVQPSFTVNAASVSISLPVIEAGRSLTDDERRVYEALGENLSSRVEIQQKAELSRDKTIRVLNSLIEMGAAEKTGSGPAVAYRRK